jgi:hypothetical protein
MFILLTDPGFPTHHLLKPKQPQVIAVGHASQDFPIPVIIISPEYFA